MRTNFTLTAVHLLVVLMGCAPKGEEAPVVAPSACVAGQRQAGSTACGLNAEGVFEQVCTDGAWKDDPNRCTGSDVCVSDSVETVGCGQRGTQQRTCVQGQWGDWGICVMPGCTDPEATNYEAEASQDDGSCRYPPSSDAFLAYAKPEYIPGRFPASACDRIEQHHRCVSTQGCNWLRTIKNNGICRQDPVSRCLDSGECVCRAHDFHGDESHDSDLEVFVPLSITWTNLAPRTSRFGGSTPQYTTHIDMSEVVDESLENFTSRTDFSYKTLAVRPTLDADLDALSGADGLSLTLKFMHVWDKRPAGISGVLLSGLGMRVELDDDLLSVVVDGTSYPIQGEHSEGRIKDYQCNQLAVVIPRQGNGQVYLGGVVTEVPGLNMAAVQAGLSTPGSDTDVLRLGLVNAKVWDLRVYGRGRQLSAEEVATIGQRCGEAGEYPIPDGYPNSNRRYAWGMGGYDIVPNHATQSYSSGVYVTMRVPEPDTFPPTDSVYRDNLNRMIGFWDRWQEQMFFEMDFIPFVDRRQLSPADSKNTYRDFSAADGLGENVTGSREPANYNNPCRYVTDLFQGFNWLPEDFPGEPTSADHRKIAERGGWTRWDSHDPTTYGAWQRPVHEHGHTTHFTLMRTYRKNHYIRGIAGESFAEVMLSYVLTGLQVWMTTGLTYYPSIPLAFEGRWDSSQQRHVFKSHQPYQEKNIDDLGLGARFYGLGAWWFYVSHYVGKPYLIGRLSADTGETPGTTIQRTRFYLAQEGLDFGELFGDFVAHMATWDWPYTGHYYYDVEQAPFQGIEGWCTENSGPDCSVNSLKIQADVDPATGTRGEWVDGPDGVAPGGFAYNTIRIKDAEGGALYSFDLEFDVPSQLYAISVPGSEDFHIRLTPKCKDDPRMFSSRIVVSEVGAAPQARRASRPHYYKIPGRTVENVIVEVPPGQTSDIYLLPIPTPPFELEDVYPFVQGFSLVWPYRYRITKLERIPEGARKTPAIELDGDETLSLTMQEGAGFTHDCFAR